MNCNSAAPTTPYISGRVIGGGEIYRAGGGNKVCRFGTTWGTGVCTRGIGSNYRIVCSSGSLTRLGGSGATGIFICLS